MEQFKACVLLLLLKLHVGGFAPIRQRTFRFVRFYYLRNNIGSKSDDSSEGGLWLGRNLIETFWNEQASE